VVYPIGAGKCQTRNARRDLAMAAQHAVALEVAQSFLGRTLKVLVENRAGPKDLPLTPRL